MTRLVMIDVETDGLHPKRQPWEIAWIVRDDGVPIVENRVFLGIDTSKSDPAALRIGRYWERHPDPHHRWVFDLQESDEEVGVSSAWDVAGQLSVDLHEATLVGANPAFDAETLARFLRGQSHAPTWHYRLLDVQAMCAGAFGWDVPRGLDDCMAALGLTMPERDRHTALGDARAVSFIYDMLRGRASEIAGVIESPDLPPEHAIEWLRTAWRRS